MRLALRFIPILLAILSPWVAAEPDDADLDVTLASERDALVVAVQLNSSLPPGLDAALPSGAQVRVVYAVRVKAHRRFLWNRRLWRGEVTSSVAFDPVTGRYHCELVLDDIIVDSLETPEAELAQRWLTSPPPFRLSVSTGRKAPAIMVRVRAIFSSSTRWLLFPSIEATDWYQVALEQTS